MRWLYVPLTVTLKNSAFNFHSARMRFVWFPQWSAITSQSSIINNGNSCSSLRGTSGVHIYLLLLLPLALQPTVGFGLSNNVLPFFPICHQLSPSSHSHHLKISFYFLFPSFPGSSPSSRPFQFLSEDLLGILFSSILSTWPNQLILCPFIHFAIFSPLLISSSSRFVRLFHSPFSYLEQY